MIKTLYLVGSNNGDGSLSIQIYDDIRVANWHEDHDEEGFAEPTVRQLDIESDSPIKVEATSVFQYYLDLIDYGDQERITAFKKDFGDEFPEFSLEETEVENAKMNQDGYKKVHVMVNNKSVHYFFRPAKESLEGLRKQIAQGIERTY